jgi:hypothetical protein
LAEESLQPELGVALGKGKHFLFVVVLLLILIVVIIIAIIIVAVFLVVVAAGGTGLDHRRLGCFRLAGALLLSLALWGSGGSGRSFACSYYLKTDG